VIIDPDYSQGGLHKRKLNLVILQAAKAAKGLKCFIRPLGQEGIESRVRRKGIGREREGKEKLGGVSRRR